MFLFWRRVVLEVLWKLMLSQVYSLSKVLSLLQEMLFLLVRMLLRSSVLIWQVMVFILLNWNTRILLFFFFFTCSTNGMWSAGSLVTVKNDVGISVYSGSMTDSSKSFQFTCMLIILLFKSSKLSCKCWWSYLCFPIFW